MTTIFQQRHNLPPNIRLTVVTGPIFCDDETLDDLEGDSGTMTPPIVPFTLEEREPPMFSTEWLEQERCLKINLEMPADLGACERVQ